MLPDVDAEQGRGAAHQRRVLVGRRGDGEARGIVDQPRPAAAEPRRARGADLPLELAHGTERHVDRLAERARRKAAVVGGHGLPEQAVVEMPAAVVAYQRALVLGQGLEVAEHILDGTVRPGGSLECGVEAGDVAPVVLVVVETHRQLVDRGLQRAVRIRQRWQCMRHGTSVTRRGGPRIRERPV